MYIDSQWFTKSPVQSH